MNKNKPIKRLFNPRTIALFGGEPAAEVMRQCQGIGFAGEFWPVHPKRDELNGIPCFRSIDDLPGVPDASFIGTGPAVSIELLKQLNALGAGGAVCYASGFAEAGDEGSLLQDALLEAAGDMAIIGPNCHGMINYLDGIALWPDEHGGQRVDSGVAIILQSGNIGISISMQDRGLSISHLITVGNKADLGMHDYINALLDDPRVTAIGLHIEGLEDVDAFSEAAIRALKKKIPIAAIKTGTSALGAQTTMSHTSSLAGSDELYSSLFKRLGVARCDTIDGFIETLKFVSVHGVIENPTVASMSCSGGEASMIADLAEGLDLQMTPFSDSVAKSLHETLGDKVSIANPLDYHTYIWGDEQGMTDCYRSVLNNGCEANILVIDYPRDDMNTAAWEVAEQALIAACRESGRKAVLMATMPENIPQVARDRLLQAGIAPMQGLRECLLAIRAAADIGMAQSRADDTLAVASLKGTGSGSRTLDELESKEILADFGLSVPRSARCTAETVVEAASGIGFPVCLKILSSEIAHKSDVGGVYLGIKTPEELQSAANDMKKLGNELLVEEMVPAAIAELIVGVKREPGFGIALVIGAGGVLVELVNDSESLLLPVQESDIANALDRLKISKILNGFRGGPSADRRSIIDAILAIARFATENSDRILELDVNPLLILEDRAVAADALIRLAD